MNAKRTVVAGIVSLILLALVFVSSVGLAHNAGHIHLPNGQCVDVGSGKHAHNPDKQDKLPEDGDQYGARFAATRGNTPIIPRHCDDPRAHPHP